MAKILALPLRRANAQQLLREWARDTKRVIFTKRAKDQMQERGITDIQVFRCLRLGNIVQGPSETMKGGWKLDLQVQSSGDVIEVAAELNLKDQVIIITAYMK